MLLSCVCFLASSLVFTLGAASALAAPANDIIFVTQPPFPTDFATINSNFGNQRASLDSVPRGGDLYIRYADGTLKNLTQTAGFGNSGQQGAQGIAVRDPSIHWSGTKAIFSMVIGAPTKQFVNGNYRWQLYEVTGFGKGQTPFITKVQNQPSAYNNIMPAYASDDTILFISDRPRDGSAHLYPQRDEYESIATNTGLWSLNPANGALALLDHAPSGDFNPTVDSFGRVVFTRWDHMQRDQQVGNTSFNPFNYASEAADAARSASTAEVYPEPRVRGDPELAAEREPHTFNHFFPWTSNQDGSAIETLNHLGRQDLHAYVPRAFNNDRNVEEFYGQYQRFNQNPIRSMFQIKESPATPGLYYGIDAPEFGTHGGGQIIAMQAPPGLNANQIVVQYVTSRATADPSSSPSAAHTGFYRDPLPLSDGSLVASHTGVTVNDANTGSAVAPISLYSFRITSLKASGNVLVPDQTLTSGITKSVTYWDPDSLISFNNVTMWELQPVEVRARTRPPAQRETLPAPEKSIFDQAGVDPNNLISYMKQWNLALIVSRNVTTRDDADLQQPYNLKVETSSTQTIGKPGKIYPVEFLQVLQADQIRGYGGIKSPQAGRRVLAQPMHASAPNPIVAGAPQGSVRIGADGSLAAFVPAQRALTWHLTDSAGYSTVKERYWVTFKPGEIRICTSCHGVNSIDQAGHAAPANPPQALAALLKHWAEVPHNIPPPTPIPSEPPPGSTAGGEMPRISLRIARLASASSRSASTQIRVTVHSASKKTVGKSLTLQVSASKSSCGAAKRRFTARKKDTMITVSVPGARKGETMMLQVLYNNLILSSKRVTMPRMVGAKTTSKSCPRVVRVEMKR